MEGPSCWNNSSDLYEYGYPGTRGLPHVHDEKIFDQDHADGPRLDTVDTYARIGFTNCGSSCLISSHFNYFPLFELMCEIIMIHEVEHVRLQAVSVMNLIVARSNAYLEREKYVQHRFLINLGIFLELCDMLNQYPPLYRYGTDIPFQSISKLLKKGAHVHVKKKAVHLLHMLLNCEWTYLFGHVLGHMIIYQFDVI